MASSEEEIQLDLNKPPPHLEGELLKQNSTRTALLGQKGWKKYYFTVCRDKLQYYRKKEDCPSKEPIAFVRMSQIEDITEAVFNDVPHRHHLNCGFRIVVYRAVAGERETINLLAETPDEMKEWVRTLRYIKQYWSKMEIRETLISEEQERRLIEKILREEQEDREIVPNGCVEDEQTDRETALGSVSLVVYFDDSSKASVKVNPSDTTADLLDKVKDRVTSSAALLWLVDNEGHESVLSSSDHPALFQNKAYKFYALGPSKRVLVVFFNGSAFESLCVPITITSVEVLEHRDIATQLDFHGIGNKGLFLKSSREEHMFDSNECPCEALFFIDDAGSVVRISEGNLLVKNKALGGRSQTSRYRRPTIRSTIRTTGTASQIEEEKAGEEESTQAKALEVALQKRVKLNQSASSTVVASTLTPADGFVNITSGNLSQVGDQDDRGLEEPVNIHATLKPNSTRGPLVITSPVRAKSLKSSTAETRADTRLLSVTPKPRSPSPKRTFVAEDPAVKRLAGGGGGGGGLKRQGATRTSGGSSLKSKSPSPLDTNDKLTRTESTNTLKESSDQVMATPTTFVGKAMTSTVATPTTTGHTSQTVLLQNVIDNRPRPSVLVPEEIVVSERPNDKPSNVPRDMLGEATPTTPSVFLTTPTSTPAPPPAPPPSEPFRPVPMVINMEKLASLNKAPPTDSTPSSVAGKPIGPIDIRTPNMLKMVLFQASEPSSVASDTTGPMDFISLSGVCLKNERGTWRMAAGSSFHDAPPTTSTDHTESFPLTGGIRAVFNHTHKCWHILPPLMVAMGEPLQQEPKSLTESQKLVSVERSDSCSKPTELYLSKKALVTGVGGAIHSVLAQFEQTRSVEEKKRIGCDMTNPNMGHLVRGALSTAMARVLLDGLKPYRFQGLVTDDIWKVASAFWQEAVTKGRLLPAVDKQVFQPIRYLDGSYDNNMKYRTFICSAMNKGALSSWIETLPNQKDTLTRHFQPTAFLMLVSESEEYGKLFNELLVILEPLMHIPFSFSVDFELRQVEAQSQFVAESTSKEEPLQRSNVILKTNASTGQTTGNIVNAVWESPTPHSTTSEPQEDVDTPKSTVQSHFQKQTSVSHMIGSLSVTTSGWLKKMSSSLQQFDINAGGALITKSPAPKQPAPPPSVAPPPPAQVPLRRVEAVFSSIAEEADELPFQKGDILILKEEINAEWYICTKGDQTGIVPANYVQLLEKLS